MPLQNRVTPFGEIVALPQRGLFTGNRGIIHNPATRTLLPRRWTSRRWLICSCDYKGIRREVMGRQSWTELFFLDEATALAAGHRPCFLCRREAAGQFRAAWASGNGGGRPSADAMDDALHHERVRHGEKRLHPLPVAIADLPDGAMFSARAIAYLAVGGQAFRWTDAGYERAHAMPAPDALITPPSTLRALAARYRPVLHPTSCGARLTA